MGISVGLVEGDVVGVEVGDADGASVDGADDGDAVGEPVGLPVMGISVGLVEGDVVGEEVGDADGTSVDGADDGDAVGEPVGRPEGFPVGFPEGDTVGVLDGAEVTVAVGELLGAPVGAEVGLLLGGVEGELEGVPVGEALGLPVGGSVLRMHKLDRYIESSSRLSACNGNTSRAFPGLLSIIQRAEYFLTFDSSPMPIASRSTRSRSRAASSDSYWVAASAFRHSFGPRTQSWYGWNSTHVSSSPRQISCLSPSSNPKSEQSSSVSSPFQNLVVFVQYPSKSPSPRTFGSPSDMKIRRFFRSGVALFSK